MNKNKQVGKGRSGPQESSDVEEGFTKKSHAGGLPGETLK